MADELWPDMYAIEKYNLQKDQRFFIETVS